MSGEREPVADESEREAEAAATADESRRSEAASRDRVDAEDPLDRGAQSFLDLELAATPGTPGSVVRGRAVDVERIPATEVPDDYPVTITTRTALVLRLVVDETTDEAVEVFFEWADGPGERLARLLELHEVPAERFGDLYGESILLTVVDDHYVAYVPRGGPQGSPLGVYGVAAILGLNLLSILLLAVGFGGVLTSLPVVAGWLLLNLVGLPVATYLDARYLLTHTDWEQGPAFWAFLAAIPGVNVLSSLAYLWTRRRATPIG